MYDRNMKALVMKSASDRHNMFAIEILKQNKEFESQSETVEHNLITNFFTMETKVISCVEVLVTWNSKYSFCHNLILCHA